MCVPAHCQEMLVDVCNKASNKGNHLDQSNRNAHRNEQNLYTHTQIRMRLHLLYFTNEQNSSVYCLYFTFANCLC